MYCGAYNKDRKRMFDQKSAKDKRGRKGTQCFKFLV